MTNQSMTTAIIRPVVLPQDESQLVNLYTAAFPEEDLLPLFHNLHDTTCRDVVLSIVAINNDHVQESNTNSNDNIILGHACFTICGIQQQSEKKETTNHPTQVEKDKTADTTTTTTPSSTNMEENTVLVVALLGPVCVLPSHQRHGIGSKLIREGIRRLSCNNNNNNVDDGNTYPQVERFCVLGDPKYYQRFGFQPMGTYNENDDNIQPPYPLPSSYMDMGAWQILNPYMDALVDTTGSDDDKQQHQQKQQQLSKAKSPVRGTLIVPSPWQDPSLWG